MKYADINKRFTEIVAEYMGKGYTINTATMSGSQGETAKIDLTNGTEIIRILIDTFAKWDNPDCMEIRGVEITIGKSTDDVTPHNHERFGTVWTSHLEILHRERFYQIGADRRHGIHYGTEAEAIAASKLKLRRYMNRKVDTKSTDITEKAMEIAKRIIRKKMGVKRICEADIKVRRDPGSYVIIYRGKACYLH